MSAVPLRQQLMMDDDGDLPKQREIRVKEDEYNENGYIYGPNGEGEPWNTYLHMEDFDEDLDHIRFILSMHRCGDKIK